LRFSVSLSFLGVTCGAFFIDRVIPIVIKNDRWHEALFGAPPPSDSRWELGTRYKPAKSLEESTILPVCVVPSDPVLALVGDPTRPWYPAPLAAHRRLCGSANARNGWGAEGPTAA
jgi:hypothetical protein